MTVPGPATYEDRVKFTLISGRETENPTLEFSQGKTRIGGAKHGRTRIWHITFFPTFPESSGPGYQERSRHFAYKDGSSWNSEIGLSY